MICVIIDDLVKNHRH